MRILRGRESAGAVVSTVVVLAIVFVPSIFLVITPGRAKCATSGPSSATGLGPGTFERLARTLEESRLRGLAHMILGGDPGGGAAMLQAKLQDVALGIAGIPPAAAAGR